MMDWKGRCEPLDKPQQKSVSTEVLISP